MIRWLLAALVNWAVIAVGMVAIWRWPLCAPLAVFVIGNRQHALGILGHDAAHSSVCKPLWLNDALGQVLCWWPIGVGIDSYRWFHLRHHKAISRSTYVGGPEVAHRVKFPAVYDVPITTAHKTKWFALDLIGFGLREEIALLGVFYRHSSIRDQLGPTIMLGALLFASIEFPHLWFVPVVWIVSLYTSNFALHRLRTWREHIGIVGTHDTPVPWWGFLVHLPHNIGEHAEHHHYAWKPFYHLGLTCYPVTW